MNKIEFQHYLKLLNVVESRPSLNSLTKIIQAHLNKVPFENISKLYCLKKDNQKKIPSLGEFLDGIEINHFGGTCYTNNYFLNLLLLYLGYDVKLCGADMNRSDVHIVNIVKVEGREFIVDVGYAAPFLRPLPRDSKDNYVIACGEDQYVLSPQDQDGRTRLEFYRNGNLRHGYIVKPEPRKIDEFEVIIADSFRPSATFMNAVLLVRYDMGSSFVIHNKELIVKNNGITDTKSLESTEELEDTIYKFFNIPQKITHIALEDFSFDGNAWS